MGTNIKKKKVYLETAIPNILPTAPDHLCTPCRSYVCPACKKISPFAPDYVGPRAKIQHGVIFLCTRCTEVSVFDEKLTLVEMSANYMLASLFANSLGTIAEMRVKCAISKN